MGAIDFVQFSSSTFYLTETNTSLVKFTKSLEDCTTTNSLPALHSISHIIQPPQLSQADSRIFLFFYNFSDFVCSPKPAVYDWKSITLHDFNILQTIGFI